MPKVSVIVPSYNLGRFLPETLQSLVNQSYSDWECIIVDNGSTDNSLELASEFVSSDSRFRLEDMKTNAGVAAARNRGIELAVGEYLLFLDADDLLATHYMGDAVAALDADPSLAVVYGRALRFGAQKRWDIPEFSMDTMLASNCLYISCFIRARMLSGARFDSSFTAGLEDWDFWLSYLGSIDNPKVLCLPSVCFYYRPRRHSRNRGVSDEALKSIRRSLWEKHKDLYAKYFCDPLQTIEYRRLHTSFVKASKWSLAWKLRLLYRKICR